MKSIEERFVQSAIMSIQHLLVFQLYQYEGISFVYCAMVYRVMVVVSQGQYVVKMAC